MTANTNSIALQFYLKGNFQKAYSTLGECSSETFINVLFSWWKLNQKDSRINERLRTSNRRGIPFFFTDFLVSYGERHQIMKDLRYHEFLRFYFQNPRCHSPQISLWLAESFPEQLISALRHNRTPFLQEAHWKGLQFLKAHPNEELRSFYHAAEKIKNDERQNYEQFLLALNDIKQIPPEEALCLLGHWMVVMYAEILLRATDEKYAARQQYPFLIANHWFTEFLRNKKTLASNIPQFDSKTYFENWYGKRILPETYIRFFNSIEKAGDWYVHCHEVLDQFCFDDFAQFNLDDKGNLSRKTTDPIAKAIWKRDGRKHTALINSHITREDPDWLEPLIGNWDWKVLAEEIIKRSDDDIHWLENWHIDHYLKEESSGDDVWELCVITNQLKFLGQMDYGFLLDKLIVLDVIAEKIPYAIFDLKREHKKFVAPLMEVRDTNVYKHRGDNEQMRQAFEIFRQHAPLFVSDLEAMYPKHHNRFEPAVDFMRDTFIHIGDKHYFFPHLISNWVVPVQLIQRALYWKKRRDTGHSRKRETDSMEAFLEEKMCKVFKGITIAPNLEYSYRNSRKERIEGEIDLLVSHGNNVLLIEIKRSPFHPHPKERIWERNLSLNLAARQINKAKTAYTEIREQLNTQLAKRKLPPLPITPLFHSLIVSTSLEWDHARIEGHLKVSWYELTQLLEMFEKSEVFAGKKIHVGHLLSLLRDDAFWKARFGEK